jgi:elongation factor Ts
MEVTASLVKELRERTGAGMMDCKKVLVETSGDMEKAIEVLREKGLAKAAKKAGRVASQGLVKLAFSADGKKAAVIEVNSETDFVAKNEEFIEFVDILAVKALEAASDDKEAFMALPYKEEGTVQDALNNKIAKIGENMNVRRFTKCETPGVVYVGYSHGNGKIGVSSFISDGYLCVFTEFLDHLDQFFSAFFCNRRNYKANDFSVIGRIDSQIGNIDCLFNIMY